MGKGLHYLLVADHLLDQRRLFPSRVGQLSCFLSYANQYTKPFNEISGVVTELQNALACAARIFALIEEEPQIPDKDNAVCGCFRHSHHRNASTD